MRKPTTKKRPKVYTGVSLDSDVADYLEVLVEHTRLNRSLVLNAVVREHAKFLRDKTGHELMAPLATEVIRL